MLKKDSVVCEKLNALETLPTQLDTAPNHAENDGYSEYG